MNKKGKLLIIGFVWPEPNSSAAGSRMIQLIDLFSEKDYEITFASTAATGDFTFDVEGLDVRKEVIALNAASFDVFVKELNADVVLFDRFMTEEQFGWRVAEQCPDAIRILDTEDLHCLRHARQAAVKANREFSFDDLDTDVAKREIASILRSDVSLIISEFEIDLLLNHFKLPKHILLYLPLFSESTDSGALPTFEERNDFVFIGNFLHEPNWDAVQYLSKEIWPKIHSILPKAKMQVYGAYPSQKVLQLNHPKTNFFIKGRAESASNVIKQAKVLLAPIRFGAGLKGKLLEAMQFGTPSVTTSIGAEGMNGVLEWNGFVNDDPVDFANLAVMLCQDKLLWEQKQLNGFEILNNRFLKSDFKALFDECINNVRKSLKAHRRKNFMGSILQHHTLSSTKYMSKWIEEKNK